MLIVLAIAIVLFGIQRLRNVGSDLGAAIKTLREAVKNDEEDKPAEDKDDNIVGKEKSGKDKKTDTHF